MSFFKEIPLSTRRRTELTDITGHVEKAVTESKVKDGICYIYVPHTTAAVTINENADRSVVEDIRSELDKLIPFDDDYGHMEGNSAAHIKASVIGSSQTVFIANGKLKFGTWQGIFFCECDGPRSRKIWIKVM
jgi:secondary thiamine-phosphate synthase enzyme